tara:strand:+ start:116 stop:493 length:378 start_codon:yes stop_codon:yes gene_type:complete
MSTRYDNFKRKIMEEKNVDLSKIGLGKLSFIETIAFFTNCLVFPAVFFQARKTIKTQEAQDVNVVFNTLQLVGGTPEGYVGYIIGNLINNTQMMAIGLYAIIFRTIMLFYILFGRKGLIKDLFTK